MQTCGWRARAVPYNILLSGMAPHPPPPPGTFKLRCSHESGRTSLRVVVAATLSTVVVRGPQCLDCLLAVDFRRFSLCSSQRTTKAWEKQPVISQYGEGGGREQLLTCVCRLLLQMLANSLYTRVHAQAESFCAEKPGSLIRRLMPLYYRRSGLKGHRSRAGLSGWVGFRCILCMQPNPFTA